MNGLEINQDTVMFLAAMRTLMEGEPVSFRFTLGTAPAEAIQELAKAICDLATACGVSAHSRVTIGETSYPATHSVIVRAMTEVDEIEVLIQPNERVDNGDAQT